MRFKLAIFDLDGTVVESNLDWAGIKEELGIPGKNILREIYKNNGIDREKLRRLEQHEEEHTHTTRPIPGIVAFLGFLKSSGVTRALTTNNNQKNTRFLLNKYSLDFETVITREMRLWKPDPDAFLFLMDHYGCGPKQTLVIGDSHYDIQAAKSAGITDIFIINSHSAPQNTSEPVVYFNDFIHLLDIMARKTAANT